MNLDEHGAACRCLLRVRENEGRPGMSDAAFIARFLPRYPEWQTRPGAVDATAIWEIARALGLAEQITTSSDYDEVLREHLAGRSILVCTTKVPEQRESGLGSRRHVMLMLAMDADGFTVWCPFANGMSDNLPYAARRWWDRWGATGIALHPAVGAAVAAPA